MALEDHVAGAFGVLLATVCKSTAPLHVTTIVDHREPGGDPRLALLDVH